MKKTPVVASGIAIAAIAALIVMALISGLGLGLRRVREIFGTLDMQTSVVLGVVSLTVLLSAWLIAAALRAAKACEIESARQRDRTRLYLELLETLPVRHDAMFVSPLAKGLLLIGRPAVVQEYRALTQIQMISAENASEAAVRMQINRLILAMRRDVGESTFGLDQEDWSGWLPSPLSDKPSEPINGATSAHRPEFMAPAVRLSNRA